MAVLCVHLAVIPHICLLLTVGFGEKIPSDAAALVDASPSNLTVAESFHHTVDNSSSASIALESATNDTSLLSDTAQLALAFQNEINDGQVAETPEQETPRKKLYRLLYFESRGRAEPIRLIFHYARQRFDDFHIPSDDWIPFYKNNTPYGHVPILEEWQDGDSAAERRVLAESYAIARYLARKFGLAGGEAALNQDEVDFAQAKVDEFADFHRDVSDEFHGLLYPFNKTKSVKQTKKAEAAARHYFPIYERQLRNARAGLLFGANPTWVDLMVADFLESVRVTFPHVFEYSPRLRRFHADVHSLPQLAPYLFDRPKGF